MYVRYLINIKRELRAFTGLVVEIDMPPFDIDAALSRIFDCFQEKATAMQMLHNVAMDMADHDALFENECLESFQRERLYYAIQNLGKKIKFHLDDIDPYVNGKFRFSYRRTFYGCALLMADERSIGFNSRDYRPRHTRRPGDL
jgi:hypothetical protein